MFLFIYFNPEMKWVYGPFLFITAFYLFISYVIGIFGKEFNRKKHMDFVSLLNPLFYEAGRRPTVDIYYACCGEDINVQRNALHHIVKLQLSYGENSHIYILDDSKDGVSFELYKHFLAFTENISYVRRADRPHLKKAGNLRNAFKITNGEYIAIFDADFCPSETFLYHTLPYLEHKSSIAIVYTTQFFQPLHRRLLYTHNIEDLPSRRQVVEEGEILQQGRFDLRGNFLPIHKPRFLGAVLVHVLVVRQGSVGYTIVFQ